MARYDRSFGGERNASPWWGRGRDFGWEEPRGPNAFWGRGEGRGGYDRGVYGEDYPAYGGYPGGRREGMHYGGGMGQGGGMGYRGGTGYGGSAGPSGGIGRGRPRPRYAGEYADRPETYHDTGRGYDSYLRGYDRGMGGDMGGGMGRGFAREPFMPEAAYLRHPEYDRPPTNHQYGWEGRGRYQVGEPEEMSDDEIQQEVRQRLYQDSWLDADRIEVDVDGGVVTLRGEVDDFMEARYAWDDAWETDGVRGVVTQLTVRTDQPQEHVHGDAFSQSAG